MDQIKLLDKVKAFLLIQNKFYKRMNKKYSDFGS